MVICLERGADLHTAQLMPLPLTVSCFSKIQIGFTFLAAAHLCSPGKRPLNGCVCVCDCVCVFVCFVRGSRTLVVKEEALSARRGDVQQGGLESHDEFVAERRVDDCSSMSHLAQPHRPPSAARRSSLLQRREHRTPGPAEVRPAAGRRDGRRPREVVRDDGDALARAGAHHPRAAEVVGVEGGHVAGAGRERSVPGLGGAGSRRR